MLDAVEFTSFGPLTSLKWPKLGPINLVIGENGTGKTFLLKAMYSVTRTLEEYKRGKEQHEAAEILADKLYWTFQPEKIGDPCDQGRGTARCRAWCGSMAGTSFSASEGTRPDRYPRWRIMLSPG